MAKYVSEEKELPSDLLLALGVCDVDDFPNNNVNGTHFSERQSLCLLNLLRSKNALRQRKVLNF